MSASNDPPVADDAAAAHRRAAIEANNSTWELLGREEGAAWSAEEIDDVLGRAYAAAYHWRRAPGRTAANTARASWLVSHVHAVLGHGDLALHHAEQCAVTVAAAGLDDFDLAYAHEARARALACVGRLDEARAALDAATSTPIGEEEDHAVFVADVAAGPWYGLGDRRAGDQDA